MQKNFVLADHLNALLQPDRERQKALRDIPGLEPVVQSQIIRGLCNLDGMWSMRDLTSLLGNVVRRVCMPTPEDQQIAEHIGYTAICAATDGRSAHYPPMTVWLAIAEKLAPTPAMVVEASSSPVPLVEAVRKNGLAHAMREAIGW